MSAVEVKPAPRHRMPVVVTEPTGPVETRAQAGTARGAAWIVFIAVELYLMSNPLVFIPGFALSLDDALALALAFGLLQWRWLRPGRVPWSVVLFLGFAGLSQLWSGFPSESRFAWEVYLAIAVMAWFTATQVKPAVLSHGLLAGGVLVTAISCYAAWAAIPGSVLPPDGGGVIAGVGTNRNILAYTLALSLPALGVPPRSLVGRLVWLLGLGVVLMGMVLAGSGTGLIVAAFCVLVVLAMRSLEWVGRRSRRLQRALRAGLAGALLVAPLALGVLAALLGRDATTFSGRTYLWASTWEVSKDALWGGYGWGVVWRHPWLPAPYNHVEDRIILGADGTWYSHGHNSVFDLLPQVGLIGVALALAIHVAIALRAVRSRAAAARMSATDPEASRDAYDASRLLVLGLAALMLFGAMEPLFTIPIGWFVLVMVACVSLDPGVAAGTGSLGALRRRRSAAPSDAPRGSGTSTG